MKIVGLLLTFNCENFVDNALNKIPKNSLDDLICSDDGSIDKTVEILKKKKIKYFTHKNLGYGGNLYYGLQKAFEMGATHVVELHGDGQYDFQQILNAKNLIIKNNPDLILGNRFYEYKAPIRNGMGIVKYFGNIFITKVASFGIGISSRDLFPGFRIYSKKFFKTINFNNLSKFYFFSFEIIALSKFYNLKIEGIPIDCDYKKEHSSMSMLMGIPFIFHTIKTIIFYRLAKIKVYRGIFKNLYNKN